MTVQGKILQDLLKRSRDTDRYNSLAQVDRIGVKAPDVEFSRTPDGFSRSIRIFILDPDRDDQVRGLGPHVIRARSTWQFHKSRDQRTIAAGGTFSQLERQVLSKDFERLELDIDNNDDGALDPSEDNIMARRAYTYSNPVQHFISRRTRKTSPQQRLPQIQGSPNPPPRHQYHHPTLYHHPNSPDIQLCFVMNILPQEALRHMSSCAGQDDTNDNPVYAELPL